MSQVENNSPDAGEILIPRTELVKPCIVSQKQIVIIRIWLNLLEIEGVPRKEILKCLEQLEKNNCQLALLGGKVIDLSGEEDIDD